MIMEIIDIEKFEDIYDLKKILEQIAESNELAILKFRNREGDERTLILAPMSRIDIKLK